MAPTYIFITLLMIGPTVQASTAPTSNAQTPTVTRRVECREWHQCRQLALDAYASGDYERFHDLAWRTVQTGPPRDPDLMYLLARAQSLSGRPHDALVMLGRLAEMGVATDTAVSDEFRVVRTLPDWPRVEALIAAIPGSAPASGRTTPSPPPTAGAISITPSASASSISRAPVTPPPAPVIPPPASVIPPPASVIPPPASAVPPPAPAVPPPAPAIPRPAPAVTSSAPVAALFKAEDAVRVPAATLNPTGLSYDRVSGRFVVADRDARKLVIIDERSRHVVDLVSAESAGFKEITALEIDGRRGELWVVSAAAAGSDSQPTTELHKVQLVSGRPLAALPLPEPFGAARFDDVAVSEKGTVLMLDGLGKRIFRLGADQRSFMVAAPLDLDHPTSLAPVDDRIVYVAHPEGVERLDMSTGTVTPLAAPKGVQLGGFERIRWDRDALLGIQRLPDGTRRVVSVRLSRSGGRATTLEVIAPDVSMTDPTAATLSEHVFYFVTREPQRDGGEPEIIVRRAQMR